MIFSIAKTFLLKKPIIWKAAAGLAVSAVIAFFVWDYTNTKREADRLSDEAEMLFQTVEEIKSRVDQQQSQINQANRRTQQIETEIVNRINRLTQLRNTPIETEEDQQAVEDEINQTFQDLNRDLSCITGNSSACIEQQ